MEHQHTIVTAQVDAHKAANIKCNHAVLKSITRAVLFCGRWCIALREDAQDLDSSGNPGNLALLKLLAIHDNVPCSHLEAPAMQRVTHTSPQTQNELIEVVGKHMILQGILDGLNAVLYHTILASEVTAHNVEHLTICDGFVDGKKTIERSF